MKDIALYEKIKTLENKFPVKFFKQTSEFGLLPHWHEHIELLYFLSGECEFFCDGKHYYVKEGDLIVANSTEIHSFTSIKAPVSYYCIITYPSFFEDISFSDIYIKNHISNDVYIRNCILNMSNEKRSQRLGSDMMIKSHNYMLFTHLIRSYRDDDVSKKESISNSSKLKRLDKVFKYISYNYNEKITVSHLASISYLSDEYFCRFFKSATGRTVTDYITEFRIEKASLLIEAL